MTDWNDLFGTSADGNTEEKSSEVKKDTQKPDSSAVPVPDEKTVATTQVADEKIERPVEQPSKPKEISIDTKSDDIIKEVSNEGGEVYTIYGNKGNGKTFLCYSFPGDIAVLSFDGKSYSIKKHQYDNDERIRVYNAREKLDETTADAWLQTS